MRNMSHDMDVKNMPHVSLRSDTFILDLQLMVEFLFHLLTFKSDPRNTNTRLVNMYTVSAR
jgi:hypothetical protein